MRQSAIETMRSLSDQAFYSKDQQLFLINYTVGLSEETGGQCSVTMLDSLQQQAIYLKEIIIGKVISNSEMRGSIRRPQYDPADALSKKLIEISLIYTEQWSCCCIVFSHTRSITLMLLSLWLRPKYLINYRMDC